MNDHERGRMWAGLQAIGWWRLLGALTTGIGLIVSATWIGAITYTSQADPLAVVRNTDGVRTARDSIQILARESYAIDSRQDTELTRLGTQSLLLDQRTDSVLVALRDMRLAFLRFLCREEGRDTAFCERTVR